MNNSQAESESSGRSRPISNGYKTFFPRQGVKKTSRIAITAFSSVIVATACLLLPVLSYTFRFRASFCLYSVGVVLGIAALVLLSFNRDKVKGRRYAIIAVAAGLFFISVGMGSLARFANSSTRHKLRRLGKTIIRYAEDNDGLLPAADQWCDILMQYDKNLSKSDFRRPFWISSGCTFAFNSNLDGVRLTDVPGTVALVLEVKGDWNLSGGEELLKRRGGLDTYLLLASGDIYEYYDERGGIVRWDADKKKDIIESVRWKP